MSTAEPEATLKLAAWALRAANRVVVFTGAGVSAESGVPTFRDAATGLWARFDPRSLDTPEAYAADPALVWGWYEWRRQLVRAAAPNPGHLAIARIERQVPRFDLVTQNIDDLHERAGSTDPVHLHGSLFAPRCASCGQPADVTPTDLDPAEVAPADPDHEGGPIDPPACLACGDRVRPGVVWFGEALPGDRLDRATEAAAGCDLLLAVGTAGVVYPAAEVPLIATRRGATVVQVNPDRTPLDPVATWNLRGPAGQVLPSLVAAAWPEPGSGG